MTSRNRVEDFGPYRDGTVLFDLVVHDMRSLESAPCCYRLIGQQIGSADSICANIEEGFGRLSRAEFIRFLDIARGSARETLGRYKRMKHWLAEDIIHHRVGIADSIIARLTKTIYTLKSGNAGSQIPPASGVREQRSDYNVFDLCGGCDTISQNTVSLLLEETHFDTRHVPVP